MESHNYDVAYQISTNVLPPFTPSSPPPERLRLGLPNEEYRCLDCGDKFWLESSLSQHLQRRSVYITFNCSACKKVLMFFNRCTLLGHVRAHHDRNQMADIRQAAIRPLPRELIPCIDELSSTLSVSPDLSKPNSSTLSTTMIQTESTGGVLKISKPATSNSKIKCKCHECQQQCGSLTSLQEHFDSGQVLPSEVNTQCSKCDMVCPSVCSLASHQRIHSMSKPFICPECGQNVSETWENFQRHLSFECFHYSRTVGFKCSACSFLLVTPEQLRHHVITNHSESYYKCQACPMAFRAESTFDSHRKMVHLVDGLQCSTIRKCPLCEVVFQSNDVLQNHLENHFQEVLKTTRFIFRCSECNHLFDSKMLLNMHLQQHHPRLFSNTMDNDGDTFLEKQSDKRQLKLPKKRLQLHPNKSPNCKMPCLTSKVNLGPKAHYSLSPSGTSNSETSGKPRIILSLKEQKSDDNSTPIYTVKKVTCPSRSGSDTTCECGRVFNSAVGLRVHKQRSHGIYNPTTKVSCDRLLMKPSPSRSPDAGALGNKHNVSSSVTLRSTLETCLLANGSGSYPCNECGREFQTGHACNVHRQRCHSSDNVKSRCAVCQEYLPDAFSMAKHGHQHLAEGTLVCTLCNNLVFSTKLALSRHIENHANNMSYPLKCAYCGERLDESESAISHWRTEHNLSSFQCDKCHCQYLYKKSLMRHIHSVHDTNNKKRLHKCTLCGKGTFTKSSLLKKHMEEVHAIATAPSGEKDVPLMETETASVVCSGNDDETEPATQTSTSEDHNKTTEYDSVDVKVEVDEKVEKKADVSFVENKGEEGMEEKEVKAIEEEEEEDKQSAGKKYPKTNSPSDDSYSCAKCDFRTKDRDHFQTHIPTHKTESGSFQCLECGICFVVEPSLRKHLMLTHKIKNLDTFLVEHGYNHIVSTNSGTSTATSSQQVNNGSGSNDGQEELVNPLECNVCFISFENDLTLRTHMRTHGMAFIRSKRKLSVQSNDPSTSAATTPVTTPTKGAGDGC